MALDIKIMNVLPLQQSVEVSHYASNQDNRDIVNPYKQCNLLPLSQHKLMHIMPFELKASLMKVDIILVSQIRTGQHFRGYQTHIIWNDLLFDLEAKDQNF